MIKQLITTSFLLLILITGSSEQKPDKYLQAAEKPQMKVNNQNISTAEAGTIEKEQPVSTLEKSTVEEQEKGQNERAAAESIEAEDTGLNKYVLEVINTYGNYPYLLNNDYSNYNGVTENIIYQGRIIAKAHPSGNRASHCVGLTFEVFFKAMQKRNKVLGLPADNFNGMTPEELRDFMLIWYVANGDKTSNNIAIAVEKYGLGERVKNLEDAKPGDFIDFSRENNTGHTAVFIDWVRKNGRIIGVKYWSTQQSTNGISYNVEYFNVVDQNGNKYGNVMIDNVYIARINPVTEYRNH